MPHNTPMEIDDGNRRPVHGNPRTCQKCGQPGHKANKCRNGQSQQGNQRQQSSQGQQGGHTPPPTYSQTARDDNNNRTNNNRNRAQQSSQTPEQCTFCGKIGHKIEQCYRNPANKKDNGGSNVDRKGKAEYKKTDIDGRPTEGHVFKDLLLVHSGPETYCPTCNSRDHDQKVCERVNLLQNLISSAQVCWRCGFRGHTADECQNPNQIRCAACYKTGHRVEDCKASKLFQLRSEAVKSKRFVWGKNAPVNITPTPGQEAQLALECRLQEAENRGEDVDHEDLARAIQAVLEQQVVPCFNHADKPLPYISLTNDLPKIAHEISLPQAPKPKFVRSNVRTVAPQPFNTTTATSNPCSHRFGLPPLPAGVSPQEYFAICYEIQERKLSDQQRAIRKHVDRSAQLYKKQNYNNKLAELAGQIEERRILSSDTHFELKKRLAWGCTFWRDPKAMEALANNEKPKCHHCGHDGVLLDRFMNADVINDPVLQVTDYEDWGLFVLFDCKCCNDGYSYVPRFEDVEMQLY